MREAFEERMNRKEQLKKESRGEEQYNRERQEEARKRAAERKRIGEMSDELTLAEVMRRGVRRAREAEEEVNNDRQGKRRRPEAQEEERDTGGASSSGIPMDQREGDNRDTEGDKHARLLAARLSSTATPHSSLKVLQENGAFLEYVCVCTSGFVYWHPFKVI